MITDFPAPNQIGAPLKYDKWRHNQCEAVLAAVDSPKRFIIQGAPTGFGKSLVYICQALLSDKRAVVLTSTKALQSQLLTDYEESGLIEIKGLNAYECIEGRPTGRFGDMRREGYRADRGLPMMCDEAPCQAGAYCPKREGGCLYYDAYRKAGLPTTKMVVTNYAYWMSIHKFGEGMGKVDMLVLDEAHNAVDELGGFIGTELRPSEVETVLPGEARVLDKGADQLDWIAWAAYWRVVAANDLDAIKASIKESERTGTNKTGERVSYATLRRARDLKRLIHKLETISSMSGDWIIDWVEDSQRRPVVKFDPVWPGEYAESALFLGVPKVVMVSATVRPKTAQMLGVAPGDVDFKEYPSTFPKAHRPIVYLPTAHMNMKSAASGMRDMSRCIDQIIARRQDRKGIIHTVAYSRAKSIYAGSEYKEMMLIHDSLSTRDTIQQFKASTRPLVLVSPVLDTGYDFPYCVGPDVRLLTSDLRWVQAGNIKVGDRLAGFDEERTHGSSRYWKDTVVVANRTIRRPRYRLTFSNGTVLVCSSDHKWLVKRAGQPSHIWVATENLRAGEPLNYYESGQMGTAPSAVAEVMDTWSTRTDRDSGYLAAAFDGEGCIHINSARSIHGSQVKALSFFQRNNDMLTTVERLLTSGGYTFTHTSRQVGEHQPGHALKILRSRDIARFIGEIRPVRLLPKFEWCGNLWSVPAYLVEKEKLSVGDVCAIETDAHTYIAEGLASHNCQCEYQIIVKVPFPVTVDKIVAARAERDKEYKDYVTMVTLVQMAGRICRAEDDWGETIILDADFGWWYFGRGIKLAPKWFNEAVRSEQVLWMPPSKLNRTA